MLSNFENKCIILAEPIIFSRIKRIKSSNILRNDSEFMEKVQVLLLVYVNMGITQIKTDNLKYAKVVFAHAWRMAKKFLKNEKSNLDKSFRKDQYNHDEFMNNSKGSDRIKNVRTEIHSSHQNRIGHDSYIEDDENTIDNEDSDYMRLVTKISRYLAKIEQMIAQRPKKTKSISKNHNYSVQEKPFKKNENSKANTKVIQKSKKRKIFIDNEKSDHSRHTQSVISEPLEKVSSYFDN